MAQQYYYGLGRRKEATAQVRLYAKGKGKFTINEVAAQDYFANDESRLHEIAKPLELLEIADEYDVSIIVKGGGHAGQADAIVLGISKAATEINPDWRGTLKKAGFLKRDPRIKERKKYGLRAARKREQYSKR